ncbi:unnamed protein product [Parascedosporium putredinis]|uniref:Uncharacterized protein n=1 Tax=Parascedosporium putredinis TaxID=1442378 RepID=A0A9P1H1Y9_9PEZI|nr:unnamed protein product [Parascedosporium putredinis]CAI7995600.1 unnamed protein product [Parascedosporium putredinis]
MASTPLSSAHDSTLNIATPQTSRTTTTTPSERHTTYEVTAFTTISTTATTRPSILAGPPLSLPHDSALSPRDPTPNHVAFPANKENIAMEPSPSKMTRHSRIEERLSGLCRYQRLLFLPAAPPPSAAFRSPRKVLSPVKRFPIKVRAPGADVEATPKPVVQERTMTIDEALRDNVGLQRAIQIFEDDEDDDDSLIEGEKDGSMDFGANGSVASHEVGEEAAGHDDTMVSTFSTFSAVPDMTMFSKLHNGTNRHSLLGDTTPRASGRPSQATPPSTLSDSGNTTNLLMEFTEQLRFPQRRHFNARACRRIL